MKRIIAAAICSLCIPAAIGMVWQDESSRMTCINAITDADRF